MNQDVINAVNCKLAAMCKHAESPVQETEIGKLPYYGVDTKSMPTKQELVKGQSLPESSPVRVSPFSMALRSLTTGNLPAEVSPMIEGYVVPKLETALHGKPGTTPGTGALPQQMNVEHPNAVKQLLNKIQGSPKGDRNSTSMALNAQNKGLDQLLNSKGSRDSMERGIVSSSVTPDRLPSWIPEDMVNAYAGSLRRRGGNIPKSLERHYSEEFDQAAREQDINSRLSEAMLQLSGMTRDPGSIEGARSVSSDPTMVKKRK
jgi:hypothetical protein